MSLNKENNVKNFESVSKCIHADACLNKCLYIHSDVCVNKYSYIHADACTDKCMHIDADASSDAHHICVSAFENINKNNAVSL